MARSGDSGPAQTLAQLKNSMPYLLESAPKRQNNVSIRPHSTTAQIKESSSAAVVIWPGLASTMVNRGKLGSYLRL
jgi:hypothetical protein